MTALEQLRLAVAAATMRDQATVVNTLAMLADEASAGEVYAGEVYAALGDLVAAIIDEQAAPFD